MIGPQTVIFALATSAALLTSHLAVASFIAWKDLSGAWAKYNLKRSTNTLRTYLQHMPSLLFDTTVLLIPCLLIFAHHRQGPLFAPLFDTSASLADNVVLIVSALVKAVACNMINRTWAMLIHWVFHIYPTLYKWVHKRHHCGLKDMCATSGWQDTCLEFLMMEVLGVFLLAPTLFPALCAPWQFHLLLAAYNGAAGAIDHSGFHVPGTVVDGRYHMVHHRDLYYNYAEMETLDRAFGTYRDFEEGHHSKADALPSSKTHVTASVFSQPPECEIGTAQPQSFIKPDAHAAHKGTTINCVAKFLSSFALRCASLTLLLPAPAGDEKGRHCVSFRAPAQHRPAQGHHPPGTIQDLKGFRPGTASALNSAVASFHSTTHGS